jgi:hypothetical protein
VVRETFSYGLITHLCGYTVQYYLLHVLNWSLGYDYIYTIATVRAGHRQWKKWAKTGQSIANIRQRSIPLSRKTYICSYVRKFRMEQLQSNIWLTASSYMVKYLRISSRKPFLIYDFATAPLWISLYMRKIFFSFLSVYGYITCAYLMYQYVC